MSKNSLVKAIFLTVCFCTGNQAFTQTPSINPNAGLTLEVIKKDNKLYRHRDGSPDIELKPESNTKFFYADDSNRQLQFDLDKEGKVVKIWFINNEQRGEMKKL